MENPDAISEANTTDPEVPLGVDVPKSLKKLFKGIAHNRDTTMHDVVIVLIKAWLADPNIKTLPAIPPKESESLGKSPTYVIDEAATNYLRTELTTIRDELRLLRLAIEKGLGHGESPVDVTKGGTDLQRAVESGDTIAGEARKLAEGIKDARRNRRKRREGDPGAAASGS